MKENDKSGYIADDAGYVAEGQHKLRNESHVSLRCNAANYMGHHGRHIGHQSVVEPVFRQHDDRTFNYTYLIGEQFFKYSILPIVYS